MNRLHRSLSVAVLVAAAALRAPSAEAHCHVQYQVSGPAGLFFDANMGGNHYLGLLPGGTTSQLGATVTRTDIQMIDFGGVLDASLTATDLSGSVSCPSVPLDLTNGGGGGMACTDDGGGNSAPPCTPSFTVTQTGTHAFSCASSCVSYPQPHTLQHGFTPPNSPAPSASSVSPNNASLPSPALALRVSGAGFAPASVIQWNGNPLPTFYVGGGTVLALLPPALMSSAANMVSVANTGGTSGPLLFSLSGAPTAGPGSPGPFDNLRVFPNPWRSSLGASSVTFDGIPPGSTVDIFTLAGHLVKTMDAPTGTVLWNLTNGSGQAVASGYYYYLVRSGGDKFHGRMALIR